MKKENKFAEQFESWADSVAEGTWAKPDTEQDIDQLIDLLSDELPVGVDAQNATNALYNLVGDDQLFDALAALAEQDPDADARELVTDWLQNNAPEVYQQVLSAVGDDPNYPPEQMEGTYADAMGGMDGEVHETHPDDEQIEAIASAIVRRILAKIGKHAALLKKAGPEGVLNAARDVASFHVPVEELGTSDISNMVRQVYNEVGVEYPNNHSQELDEGRMKEVSMDLEELSDEEFQAKYGKTKEEMKQALAETQGADYVNKDEKLKRMGAKKLGVMDKIKNIPHGMKAGWKGDSEDELALYNKQKAELEEMRRLAGL